ncbi:type II secretion system F family protein [Amnibacterium flavum]|uniref:Pilus assembly protein n=1 Tax=Amnibacterium flavum TaxID=2173173 RepID=A0A2V1HQP2_9MICO|nr:type II secretion system F family protein [Amnibacterium flavum]PVZ94855.1 pilus assembly protein [Amnibacterium flavum]
MSSVHLGWAILLGTSLGIGIWILVGRLPAFARPRLAARLAPQLVDLSDEARRIVDRSTADPGALIGFLAPLAHRGRAAIESVLGGRDTIALRLRCARSLSSVEHYRGQQLLAIVIGAAIGAAASVMVLAAGATSPVVLVMPVTGAVGGLVLRDQLLARSANRRSLRISQELPTVLEFMTLSLAAGEGIHDALRRVGSIGTGELASEFRGVTAEVATGVPLAASLDRLSRELRIPPLSRALDQLVAALDRGAPLAEVLRAQAQDCREQSRRDLLELAGRKEVVMLVPLVFLILPFTVALAVFPGLVVLQTGF